MMEYADQNPLHQGFFSELSDEFDCITSEIAKVSIHHRAIGIVIFKVAKIKYLLCKSTSWSTFIGSHLIVCVSGEQLPLEICVWLT